MSKSIDDKESTELIVIAVCLTLIASVFAICDAVKSSRECCCEKPHLESAEVE